MARASGDPATPLFATILPTHAPLYRNPPALHGSCHLACCVGGFLLIPAIASTSKNFKSGDYSLRKCVAVLETMR